MPRTTTRPARRSLLGAALVVLSLTACSGGASETATTTTTGGTSSAGSGLVPAAEGKTTYPLTLKTAYGESTLTKRPERILPLSSVHDAEYLSMLKVTPVAVPAEINDDIWMKDAFPQKVTDTFDTSGDALPYEAIAKAKPDLIVATFRVSEEEFAKLKAIAPVVAVEQDAGKATRGETWETRFGHVAKALDLTDAGDKAVQEKHAAMQQLRTEHPEFQGKTLTYAVYYGSADYGMTFNNGTDSTSEHMFSDMGFAKNPSSATYKDDIKVSNEKLSTLDADVMLLSDNSGQEGGKSTINTITDLALWKNLGVVKRNHVVSLTNETSDFVIGGQKYPGNPAWALNAGGPIAEEWTAKALAPHLSAALKK